MGGYKRERRTYILEFEEYDGLEIKVKSIPMGLLKKLMLLDPEDEDPKLRVKAITELETAFADNLESWNMEDPKTGKLLPTTFEYLESEDTDFVLMLIQEWMGVMTRVRDDSTLGKDSQPGQPTPELNPSLQS